MSLNRLSLPWKALHGRQTMGHAKVPVLFVQLFLGETFNFGERKEKMLIL